MKMQTLKGFRDFLPIDAIKRNFLREKIQKVFELWGYDPLETPTLEYAELFEGVIGEEEKLFFRFQDRGGREVALRYDQTVPASRVVVQYQNELTIPFKRYQIQPAFRAEKPQKGRFREFLQCDADIWGIPTALADGEVIALSLSIYKELGFKKVIAKINDRTLLKKYPYKALASIDKLKKIGKDAVLEEMIKKGITVDDAKRFLDDIVKLIPNDNLKQIFEILEQYGFDKEWYEFDPTIVRSFAYSDGPIWEIEVPGYSGGSVLGGERYNELTKKLTGRDLTGTGFGLGFDRTLEAMEELGLINLPKTTIKVLVTVFSKELGWESLKLADLLRKNNIATDLWLDFESKLDKQLKYANAKRIPYAIIIGPDEVENNQVTVKDLTNKTQQTVPLDEIVSILAH